MSLIWDRYAVQQKQVVTPREVTNRRLLWHLFWLLVVVGFVIGFAWAYVFPIGR